MEIVSSSDPITMAAPTHGRGWHALNTFLLALLMALVVHAKAPVLAPLPQMVVDQRWGVCKKDGLAFVPCGITTMDVGSPADRAKKIVAVPNLITVLVLVCPGGDYVYRQIQPLQDHP